MDPIKKKIIELILKYEIIKTNFKQPITFKSGIKSPIYCDFRNVRSFPDLRVAIIAYLVREYSAENINVIMSVYSGAATFGELLAHELELPSAYVRPDAKIKDYGLGKLIEGANISDKKVLIIEDLVSTAGSILENAQIVKKTGAKEVICAPIFSYKMKRAEKEFDDAGFKCLPLLTIYDFLPLLKTILNEDNYASLEDWVKDPEGWFNRHKNEFEFGFLTKLRESAHNTNSLICQGFDPVVEAMPNEYREDGISGTIRFYMRLIDEMRDRNIMPSMFKPNDGFYSKWGSIGYSVLDALMKKIYLSAERFGGYIPNTSDGKRGDIGKSSQNYAEQFFVSETMSTDAVTISPFMGSDSVSPFIKFCNPIDAKGVYILNKTSNPGSQDFQMQKMADGRYLYQHVSDKILAWSKGKPGVGAVVGGNSLEELRAILGFYAGKDIPVLVPGVGAQGGSAKDVANVAREVGFELSLLRINSSSGLTHPWYKKPGDLIPSSSECIEMCIHELKKLNEEVEFVS